MRDRSLRSLLEIGSDAVGLIFYLAFCIALVGWCGILSGGGQ